MQDFTIPAEEITLELEMQELESLEAPGYWTGVSIGTGISASVVASIAFT
ncbi:daptide-type RiPP [Streptomyces sp. URMC 123]